MRLWTIQPITIYELIKSTGEYKCDLTKSDYAEDETFMRSYDWMKSKLAAKSPRPDNGEMVWAWYICDGKHTVPNHFCRLKDGSKYVCLEIEIPDEEVLLSDYDNWHSVLNNGYCDTSTNEAEWYEQHNYIDALPYEERTKAIHDSWNNIFNVKKFKNEWCRIGYYVQAVFWTLKLENIISVTYLEDVIDEDTL